MNGGVLIRIYDNSDSNLNPTACDNIWWQCHYFQPTALEIYDDAYNDELYWNEINWPPPDINTDDDYGNSYMARSSPNQWQQYSNTM